MLLVGVQAVMYCRPRRHCLSSAAAGAIRHIELLIPSPAVAQATVGVLTEHSTAVHSSVPYTRTHKDVLVISTFPAYLWSTKRYFNFRVDARCQVRSRRQSPCICTICVTPSMCTRGIRRRSWIVHLKYTTSDAGPFYAPAPRLVLLYL
jgi:hypothetical protein